MPNNKKSPRAKGFSQEEAIKILSATLSPVPDRFTETRAASRRWVPWLCAYTGARVGEIAKMHSSSIKALKVPNGQTYWCMEITPREGDVKDPEARVIPLHSHLIDQGFLDYVKRRQEADKPLFYDPERARGGSAQSQVDKVGDRLREWIRGDLKIEGVQPNHGWRHRFETISRQLQIREDVVDYITGHQGAEISSTFGDQVIEALYESIEKMPRYEVDTNSTGSFVGP